MTCVPVISVCAQLRTDGYYSCEAETWYTYVTWHPEQNQGGAPGKKFGGGGENWKIRDFWGQNGPTASFLGVKWCKVGIFGIGMKFPIRWNLFGLNRTFLQEAIVIPSMGGKQIGGLGHACVYTPAHQFDACPKLRGSNEEWNIRDP